MSDDTKALIERIGDPPDDLLTALKHPPPHWSRAPLWAAAEIERQRATIARLEAERDAARAAIAEYLAAFDGADDPRAVGSTCRLIRAEGALRAAANSQENQHVTGVCRPSEQQSERDAARREAMEECARMADEYATWGGSNFAEWFHKLAAAIRAAMKGEQ